MKKDKWFAVAWAMVGLLYLGVAAFNFRVEQMAFAVPTMLLGWAACSVGNFFYGARYGINRAFDEVMSCLQSAEGILTKVELTAEKLQGGGDETDGPM